MLGGNYLRQALCCSDPFKAFEYVPALMNGFPMQARARQGKGAQTQRCLPGSPYAGAVDKSVSKKKLVQLWQSLLDTEVLHEPFFSWAGGENVGAFQH